MAASINVIKINRGTCDYPKIVRLYNETYPNEKFGHPIGNVSDWGFNGFCDGFDGVMHSFEDRILIPFNCHQARRFGFKYGCFTEEQTMRLLGVFSELYGSESVSLVEYKFDPTATFEKYAAARAEWRRIENAKTEEDRYQDLLKRIHRQFLRDLMCHAVKFNKRNNLNL